MKLWVRELAPARDGPHTYKDYAALPEGAPYQLIGGELVMTPAPGTYHQVVSMKLALKMAGYVFERDLGLVLGAPVDVYLGETEVYRPDLIFISRDRLGIVEREKINGAPDLVVEILSPATAYYDLRKKFRVYQRSGVREYWVVDPEDRSVEVYGLKQGKYELAGRSEGAGDISSKVIEGFVLRVQDIFS